MIQVVWPQERRRGQEGIHQVTWAGPARAQAVAQTSGREEVKVEIEPVADKFREDAEPGWWEAVYL